MVIDEPGAASGLHCSSGLVGTQQGVWWLSGLRTGRLSVSNRRLSPSAQQLPDSRGTACAYLT
eukprot:15435413-Alexandrium_andersonii.AAC.1